MLKVYKNAYGRLTLTPEAGENYSTRTVKLGDSTGLARLTEVAQMLVSTGLGLWFNWSGVDKESNAFLRLLAPGFLGSGCYRAVYEMDGKVYKIPLSEDGITCNRSEFDLWNRYAGTPFARYLTPVVGMEGDILIMEHAGTTVYDSQKPHQGRRSRRVFDLVTRRAHAVGVNIYDLHERNLSWSGKIIDYAEYRLMGD